MRIRDITLTICLLAAGVRAVAQDSWSCMADTMLRYGAFQTYLFDDDSRRTLLRSEESEGYERCYRRFYDTVCQMAVKAREDGDEELDMSRHYMDWQQGLTDTETARREMLQIVERDGKEHGDTTKQHVRYASIMACFLVETGRFAEAEQWCLHIDSLMERRVPVFVWHNCLKLQAQMAAQVGLCRFTDAWATAAKIAHRYYGEMTLDRVFNMPDDGYGLTRLAPTAEGRKLAAELAPRLLLPILPPPPKAFNRTRIAPWPLSQTIGTRDLKQLSVLTVFNLHDLLCRIWLSDDYGHRMSQQADKISNCVHDYSCYDSIPPPLSAELCRRTAMLATVEAEKMDTIHYLHNEKETEAMTRWRRCMTIEQQNYGERSATALLRFCGEWLKKGYPLSMLPLMKEAAATMRRDLTDEHPTQRRLLLQHHDRVWLQEELPAMRQLVADVPEYAPVLSAFEALR